MHHRSDMDPDVIDKYNVYKHAITCSTGPVPFLKVCFYINTL